MSEIIIVSFLLACGTFRSRHIGSVLRQNEIASASVVSTIIDVSVFFSFAVLVPEVDRYLTRTVIMPVC